MAVLGIEVKGLSEVHITVKGRPGTVYGQVSIVTKSVTKIGAPE